MDLLFKRVDLLVKIIIGRLIDFALRGLLQQVVEPLDFRF